MNRKPVIALIVILVLIIGAVVFYQVAVTPMVGNVLQNVYATGTAGGFSTP